ncbi:MAG: hypothetical protein WBB28_16380, partial [Crinalium sp.]
LGWNLYYSQTIKRLPIIFFFFLGVLCVLAVYKIGIRHSGKGVTSFRDLTEAYKNPPYSAS